MIVKMLLSFLELAYFDLWLPAARFINSQVFQNTMLVNDEYKRPHNRMI